MSTHRDSNIERFDAIAAGWDDDPQRRELALSIARTLAATIPFHKEMDVMEYGCGSGLTALEIAPRVRRLLAADLSPGMLAVLRRKLERRPELAVELRQLDLSRDPMPEERFDCIYTSMTLHHVQDVPGLLAQFVALLRPGGWMAVADLCKDDGGFHSDHKGVAHHGFEPKKIASALRALGLNNVRAATAARLKKPDASGKLQEYEVFLCTGRAP